MATRKHTALAAAPLLRAQQVLGFWLTGTPEERREIEQFLEKLLKDADVRLEGGPALKLVVDNSHHEEARS